MDGDDNGALETEVEVATVFAQMICQDTAWTVARQAAPEFQGEARDAPTDTPAPLAVVLDAARQMMPSPEPAKPTARQMEQENVRRVLTRSIEFLSFLDAERRNATQEEVEATDKHIDTLVATKTWVDDVQYGKDLKSDAEHAMDLLSVRLGELEEEERLNVEQAVASLKSARSKLELSDKRKGKKKHGRTGGKKTALTEKSGVDEEDSGMEIDEPTATEDQGVAGHSEAVHTAGTTSDVAANQDAGSVQPKKGTKSRKKKAAEEDTKGNRKIRDYFVSGQTAS